MTTTASNDIFISYSRLNKLFADHLYGQLRVAGYHPWMDVQKLDPGVNWRIRLQDALDSAQAMILVVSATALSSRNVRIEYLYARQQRKPIVLLLIDDSSLPEELVEYPRLAMPNGIVTEDANHQLMRLLPPPAYWLIPLENPKLPQNDADLPFPAKPWTRLMTIYQSTRRSESQATAGTRLNRAIQRGAITVLEFMWRAVLLVSFYYFQTAFGNDLLQFLPILSTTLFGVFDVLYTGLIILFWGMAGIFLFIPYQNLQDRFVILRHMFYPIFVSFALAYWVPVGLNILFQSLTGVPGFAPYVGFDQNPDAFAGILGVIILFYGIQPSNLFTPKSLRWLWRSVLMR